jgi:hypothetical protein
MLGQRRIRRLIVVQQDTDFRLEEVDYSGSRHFEGVKSGFIFVSPHRFEVMDKLEELSTYLEQEGWECLDEYACELRDVHSEALERCKVTVRTMGVSDFQKAYRTHGTCRVQAIPNGFMSILTVNAYGMANLINNQRGTLELPSSIGTKLVPLVRKKGAQGAVFEGVYDGIRFFITNVLFSNGKWNKEEEPSGDVFAQFANSCGLTSSPVLQSYSANINALDALLSERVGGLMVHIGNQRIAVCNDMPRKVSFGGCNDNVIMDERLKRVGKACVPAGLDVAYREYCCMNLSTGHKGLTGVFIPG